MIWPRKFYLILLYVFTRTTTRWWQRIQNRVVASVVFYIWRRMRLIVQKNIAVILDLPEDDARVRKTARQTFVKYGLYLIDYTRLNRLTPYLMPEQKGEEHMRRALERGSGAILLTPHLGNWELGGVTFALRGHPIHALTLSDPEVDVQDFRDRMRATLGIETVHIDPNNYGTVIKLARLLRENQVIAMLGDRWEGGKKVNVRFFRKEIAFPVGAVALALASGAPIIPAFTVMRPNGRYLAWLEEPIYVKREPGKNTKEIFRIKAQEIASVFERAIRCYPDQLYHFFDYWNHYAA